ncbi:MAG TPA: sigma-70 family RNA polymerase sigma factor [Polyangiaceae bacterium]
MSRERREESLEDAELVVRVGEGDVAAYRELVRRHGKRLHHYASRMLNESTEAEDVVQEAFLRLWQRATSYSPDARVTTWLHRIVHNLAVDRLRSRGRWQALDDDSDAPVSAPQGRQLEAARQAEALERALNLLPERQRAALLLVHLNELSGKEAARVLGVTDTALESLLSRARRGLRQLLERNTRSEAAGHEPSAAGKNGS